METLNICTYNHKSPSNKIVSSHVTKHNSISSTYHTANKKHVSSPKKPQLLINSTSKQTLSKNQNCLQNIFKSLDDFITTSLDLPLRPSIDPDHTLSGNLAPVNELPPTACKVVEGSLPSCLDGAYIRNGPNPQFVPNGPYHLYDGDGMLHMVRIHNGKATFCSRYVRTYKYMVESEMGYPIFPSPFSSFNGVAASMARTLLLTARVLTGQFNPVTNGFGLANVNVAIIGGRLFALGESDLPYALKISSDGDIITLGRHDFYADEPFFFMTAHPKLDAETGETFSFGYQVKPPFLSLFRIDPNGKKQPDVPIFSMKSTSLTHDLAVTKNYIVFSDTQLIMDPMEILRGRTPARVDSAKLPRIGVIPRYAKDESNMKWIDAPRFNMMHCFNAWEEDNGDTIVMVVTNLSSVQLTLESLDLAELIVEKVTINVKNWTFESCPVSTKVLDMGGINPAYAGKKSRYVYVSIIDHKLIGVVKLDLSMLGNNSRDCTVASRLYGPSCSGSEPFFVARDPDNPLAEEDDGYLVTYVHDEGTKLSRLLVMDAKSPDLEIVAAVQLPGRVPTGFHGLFVKECELSKLG